MEDSGIHFVILHTAIFIEPVISLVMWAEISVELQSSHLNISNYELRIFYDETCNVEFNAIKCSDCFFFAVMAAVRDPSIHNTNDYITTENQGLKIYFI